MPRRKIGRCPPDSVKEQLTALTRNYSKLAYFQCADELKNLRPWYTIQELAEALSKSPKFIRDLLLLAGLSKCERSQVSRLGRKQVIAERRAFVAAKRRWKSLAYGANSRAIRGRLARTLRVWMFAHIPAEWHDIFLDCFLHEPWARNLGPPNWARSWREIAIEDADWQSVIAKCRPPDPAPERGWLCRLRPHLPLGEPSLESMFDFWVVWLHRWVSRCMPFADVAKNVFLRVRKALRRHNRRLYPNTIID